MKASVSHVMYVGLAMMAGAAFCTAGRSAGTSIDAISHASSRSSTGPASRPTPDASMTHACVPRGCAHAPSPVCLAARSLRRRRAQPVEIELAPPLALLEPERHPLEIAAVQALERRGLGGAQLGVAPGGALAAAQLHRDGAVLVVEALEGGDRGRAADGAAPQSSRG